MLDSPINYPLSIVVSILSLGVIVYHAILAYRERKDIPEVNTIVPKGTKIPGDLEYPACSLPVLDLSNRCMVCSRVMPHYGGHRLCSLRCMETLEKDLGKAG